jgi:hypothetical protein
MSAIKQPQNRAMDTLPSLLIEEECVVWLDDGCRESACFRCHAFKRQVKNVLKVEKVVRDGG